MRYFVLRKDTKMKVYYSFFHFIVEFEGGTALTVHKLQTRLGLRFILPMSLHYIDARRSDHTL